MPPPFTIHEVTGGVWAAVAPRLEGPAVSNAAIVDLGDTTLVVDTFMTVRAADELQAEAQRLTGRAPSLVVNSHWHSDHVRGNQTFASVPIVGTERMRELIIEDSPKTQAEFEQRAFALQETAGQLAKKASTANQHSQAEGTMALAEALLAEADSYRLTLPDVLIGDRLDLTGVRRATVLNYGRAHTESDLFVHLPDDGIIIAGDLVWTEMHPKTSDGFPADWAGVLDRIGELQTDQVVAGHGQPGTAADIAAMADYVGQLVDMVAAAQRGDLDPTDAAPPTGSEDWEGLSRFRAGLARLVERAEVEAR